MTLPSTSPSSTRLHPAIESHQAHPLLYLSAVVAQLGRKYGFEDIFLAKITHDILIALSARRIGAAIITNNIKDFHKIREFVDFKLYIK